MGLVADVQVRVEHQNDVARVLDEGAEALGALALQDFPRERDALEGHRELGGECLDRVDGVGGKAAMTRDGKHSMCCFLRGDT